MNKNFKQWSCLFALCVLILGCNGQDKNTYYGYVEAKLIYLSSPFGGKLQQLPVGRGSSVKADQVLYVLDTGSEQLDIEAAQSQVDEAMWQLKDMETGKRPSEIDALKAQIKQVQKELAFHKHESERHQALVKKGAISQQVNDQSMTNYQSTKAKLESLQAQLVTAQLPARSQQITAANARVRRNQSALNKANWVSEQKMNRAVSDGYIYDTYYQVGEFVPAGTPVLSLLVPEQVKAIFYVPEDYLSSLRISQQVLLGCDGCAEQVPAQISFISQVAEYTPPVIYSQKTRHKLVFRVEADFSQGDELPLLPGQPVDVHVMPKEVA